MLQQYAAANEEMTHSYWGPDYPDPNDYLVFLPGRIAALRVGWKTGADRSLEALGKKALQTTADRPRAQLFRQIQKKLNADGPFYPLLQPAQSIVASKNLTNAVLNFTWLIDVRSVGSRSGGSGRSGRRLSSRPLVRFLARRFGALVRSRSGSR